MLPDEARDGAGLDQELDAPTHFRICSRAKATFAEARRSTRKITCFEASLTGRIS
jgi:hypothetical protein